MDLDKNYRLICGNSFEQLDNLPACSIDVIVTDPPYGLTSVTERFGKDGSAPAKYGKDGAFSRLSKGFMGKEWDGTGIERNPEFWEKCLRVLKPGGYLLAFGGTRTYHRIATAIENAGFEIKDMINWITGQGFPKGIDLGIAIDKKLGKESKVVGEGRSGVSSRAYQSEETTTAGAYVKKEAQNEWRGWKTQLKPSHEPIVVAQKPVEGTYVDNVLKYGVGGLNIDECRVGTEVVSIHNAPAGSFAGGEPDRGSDTNSYRESAGRYPANTILTYDENDFDEVCGGFPQSKGGGGKGFKKDDYGFGETATNFGRGDFKPYNDDGSAARYFKNCPFGEDELGEIRSYYYCPKASKKDRDEGLGYKVKEDVPPEIVRQITRCLFEKNGIHGFKILGK